MTISFNIPKQLAKRSLRQKMMILWHSILIVFCAASLIQDYIRLGKFQWVDPRSMEEGEELFLTPIFAGLIILSALSIVEILFPVANEDKDAGRIGFLRGIVSSINTTYGIFNFFVGALATLALLYAGIVTIWPGMDSVPVSMAELPRIIAAALFAVSWFLVGLFTLLDRYK